MASRLHFRLREVQEEDNEDEAGYRISFSGKLPVCGAARFDRCGNRSARRRLLRTSALSGAICRSGLCGTCVRGSGVRSTSAGGSCARSGIYMGGGLLVWVWTAARLAPRILGLTACLRWRSRLLPPVALKFPSTGPAGDVSWYSKTLFISVKQLQSLHVRAFFVESAPTEGNPFTQRNKGVCSFERPFVALRL